MSTSKHIDGICIAIGLAAVILAVVFCCGKYFGIETQAREMGYESRLFDTSRVHTIDIVMDGWEDFIGSCESEEYSICSAVIDGEAFRNIGIRGKGNTSLRSVASMNSERYSFKIEFDRYDGSKSYHGLDKLCLNNIIQDNTYMKDYLAYTLMSRAGAVSPLCSYAYITVNGSDWGLYLAVEGVEDAFLQRNYGSDHGELYKPDSTSFGGGRGNGAAFDMNNFTDTEDGAENSSNGNFSPFPEGFPGMQEGGMKGAPPEMPDSTQSESGFNPPQGMFPPEMRDGTQSESSFSPPQDMALPEMRDSSQSESSFSPPQGMFPPEMRDGTQSDGSALQGTDGTSPEMPGGRPDLGGMKQNFGGKGMGSDDVKLKYIDDDPDSYPNIFDNAKTDVTSSDKARLISSLKALSEKSDIESAVDTDAVLRYFAVHNFLCNGDSYTGDMVHNYYLYEKDGQLSMIPWDYNLAFGSFRGSDAASEVNSPIDSPVSVASFPGMSMNMEGSIAGSTSADSDEDDRPMVNWIFSDEKYTARYHELLAEFIDGTDFAAIIDETAALISEYVEKDPTKFCTYEEFEKGVSAIKEFCTLRAESISGQLDGTIPSTSDGQKADSSALVDASSLKISDMGSMNNGGDMRGGMKNNMQNFTQDNSQNNTPDGTQNSTQNNFRDGMRSNMREGMQNNMQGGMQNNFRDNMQNNIPYGSRGEENGQTGSQGPIAVLAAVAVLAAGILFALGFKGRI